MSFQESESSLSQQIISIHRSSKIYEENGTNFHLNLLMTFY